MGMGFGQQGPRVVRGARSSCDPGLGAIVRVLAGVVIVLVGVVSRQGTGLVS